MKLSSNSLFARFLPGKKKARPYPFLLTGDVDADVQIFSSALPSIVAIAESDGKATVLVTEHYEKSDSFKAICSRLHTLGWKELNVQISTSGKIREKYGIETDKNVDVTSKDDSSNSTHIDLIISNALRRGASDIRFHVRPESCGITFKIDGRLFHSESISHKLGDDLCAHMYANLAEKNSHEEGKTSFAPSIDQSCTIERVIDGKLIKLRYQSLPEADGYDVNLRIQEQGERGVVPTLEEMGFPPSAIAKLRKAMKRKRGMIVANGPVGSGKTTTLYCMLYRPKDQRDMYIMTFEDPPEYRQYGVTRVPVAKIGYIQAGKAALRVGADIVLVGEVRNLEMGQMAQQLQDTGQKVLTTTHCNSAHLLIHRLTNQIGLSRQEICSTDTIGLSFHQKLMPLLCEHCKQPATPELLGDYFVQQLHRLEIPLAGIFVKNKSGCAHCNGGVKGRIPVIEIIEPDEEYMRLMRAELDYEARDYWLSTCVSDLTTEDVHGKPVIANALYAAHKGLIDLTDIERYIDDLENYTPTYRKKSQPALRTVNE